MAKYFDINSIDNDYIYIGDGRCCSEYDLFKSIALEYLSWTEIVDVNNLTMPLDELLYIIDDCLVYHIEFKVENHKLFMRNY